MAILGGYSWYARLCSPYGVQATRVGLRTDNRDVDGTDSQTLELVANILDSAVIQTSYIPNIHGISVRLNGRLRTHPKIKTDANGRTPKLKRTQTDATNLEKYVIADNTPRALTTSAICREALGTSSPPQWWWCLHGVIIYYIIYILYIYYILYYIYIYIYIYLHNKELEPMVLPQRTPSQPSTQRNHHSCYG